MSKITIDREVLEDCLSTLANCRSNLFLKDCVEHIDETSNKIKDALAQPQQEPVAVVDDAGVIVVCSYKYKPSDKLYTSPPERNRQSGRGQQMNDENKNLYALPIGTADHEHHRKMIADAKVALTSAAKHLRHGDTLGASLALQPVEKTLDALSVAPHPPARQPLTDEEKLKIAKDVGVKVRTGAAAIKFANAIEAAHNIKENT